MTVTRGIDRMITTLYHTLSEMVEASGKQLPAEDAALHLALARHPACVPPLVVTNPKPMPHESALSRTLEVDRYPKPPEDRQGSPRGEVDYALHYLVRKVSADMDDALHFNGSVSVSNKGYSYTEAILLAKQEAEKDNGVPHPVVVMAVTDVFLPPERPPVHRYRIRIA